VAEQCREGDDGKDGQDEEERVRAKTAGTNASSQSSGLPRISFSNDMAPPRLSATRGSRARYSFSIETASTSV
jgi:hypothetical protein